MSGEIVGVIVSFNGSETIERTVVALQEQVDALIVVDNGSSPALSRS
jgi:glycosyltransferase involved in cell wall biosynthesis